MHIHVYVHVHVRVLHAEGKLYGGIFRYNQVEGGEAVAEVTSKQNRATHQSEKYGSPGLSGVSKLNIGAS